MDAAVSGWLLALEIWGNAPHRNISAPSPFRVISYRFCTRSSAKLTQLSQQQPLWPTIKAIIKHLSALIMVVLRSPPLKLTVKLLKHNINGRHRDIQIMDHTISMVKTNIHSMTIMGMSMRRAMTTNTSSTQVMLEEAADVANIRRRTKAIVHHRTIMAIVGVEAEETRDRRIEMVVEAVPSMVDRPRQTARGADMIIGGCEVDEGI